MRMMLAQSLKGSPADADDARPCGSLKQFKRWGRTAMRALGSPADGKERLKGSPADADDARPCRSPKAFNHWRRTAMRALGSPAGRWEREVEGKSS